MSTRELLPGVTPDGVGPRVRCDSRAVIRRARRIALARDIAQLVLVVAVDYLFAVVPTTHIPFAGRTPSLEIVALFNLAIATHVILCRKIPHWTARRTASTWSAAERRRFTTR